MLPSSQSADVLSYWQWFAHCESLNKINPSELTLISKQTLVAGSFAESTPFSEQEIWICPLSIKKDGIDLHLIWLPAFVSYNGTLQPSKKLPVPYVPMTLFDPCGPVGDLLGKPEIFEMLLRDSFLDGEDLIVYEDWLTYLNASEKLLMQLRPDIQEQGLLQETAYVMATEPTQWQKDIETSPLMSRLFATQQVSAKPSLSEKQQLSAAMKVCALPVAEYHVTEKQMETLFHLLTFDTLQAVQTPAGSRYDDLMEVLLASIETTACFLNKSTKARLLTPLNVSPLSNRYATYSDESLIETASSVINRTIKKPTIEKLAEEMRGHFNQRYQEYQRAVESAFYKFQNDEQSAQQKSKQRQELALQDEAYEQSLVAYREKLSLWQKGTQFKLLNVIKDFLSGRSSKKKKTSFLLEHSDGWALAPNQTLESFISTQIGELKVKRAKLHKELMLLSEDITNQEGLVIFWNGLTERISTLKSADSFIQAVMILHRHFGSHLYDSMMLLSALESKHYLVLESAAHDSSGIFEHPKVDVVVITSAEKLSTPRGLSCLLGASKALLLGDPQLKVTKPVVSFLMDTLALKAFGLAHTEEAIEDWYYMGRLASQSSVYELASKKSDYRHTDPDEMVEDKPLALSEYWLQSELAMYYKTYLNTHATHIPTEGAGMTLFEVMGDMSDRGGWVNPLEAEALVERLHDFNHNETAVVTLSFAQKRTIQQLLDIKKSALPVYLLEECPEHQFDVVLFSPVYTSKMPRPYLLDCGEQWLNFLLSRPKSSLVIVGDLALFDEKHHSPSGHLAKILKSFSVTALTKASPSAQEVPTQQSGSL